jgi:glutamine synthetase
MHSNVSTKDAKTVTWKSSKQATYKLGASMPEHIAIYGEGNELRLTGKFETAMGVLSYQLPTAVH